MKKIRSWYIDYENATDDVGIIGNTEEDGKLKSIYYLPFHEIEDAGDNYIAYTSDGVYELEKSSFIGGCGIYDADTACLLMSSAEKRIRRAAEKLLSEGDSLYCLYRVFYRSFDGVIRELTPELCGRTERYSYRYPEDDFELVREAFGDFTVESSRRNESCSFYMLRLLDRKVLSQSYSTMNWVWVEDEYGVFSL